MYMTLFLQMNKMDNFLKNIPYRWVHSEWFPKYWKFKKHL